MIALVIVLVVGALSTTGKSLIMQTDQALKIRYMEDELGEPAAENLALTFIIIRFL